MLRVRDTIAADVPAITAIYAGEVRHGTASFELEPPGTEEMEQRWRDVSARGFPHIVAERDGETLGYAYAGPYRPRPAYRFTVENSVYVAPQARGGGIGGTLLDELIRRCEACGARQMIAVIGGGLSHPASVALHRSRGFRVVGTLEAVGYKHGRWLDTLLMQRGLVPGAVAGPGGMPG